MSTQWVYTLNNYVMDDVHRLNALHLSDVNAVAYHVYQPEVGANGTRHLQGFICFRTRKRRSTVCNLLGGHCFVDVTRGTPQQASDYCKKEESRDRDAGFGVFETGDLPLAVAGQGKRNDLISVKRSLDEGKHLWQIPREDESLFPAVARYHRSLGIYENHITEPRTHVTKLHIHEGEHGTYKSLAAQQYPDRYYLNGGNNGCWFDSYEPNQHATVVADEFGGHYMPYTQLKRMCDRYGLNVETKGGVVAFRAKRFVITSNIDPEQWYPKYPFAELSRRITSWFHYGRVEGVPYHGLEPGTLIVTKKRGDWRHHPFHRYLAVFEPDDDQRYMLEDLFKSEQFETEASDSELIWD